MEKREQIVTKKGYDFFEVSSAFQKSIRRCKESDALYWGTELMESNFDKYLWKRMFVMVSEDVGTANADLPSQFASLHYSYEFLKKTKAREYRLPIYHAIILLVRSDKSRMIDWAHGRYQDGYFFSENNLKIPEYALDMHTRRGKKMGKNIKDFFSEGAVLENYKEDKMEKEYRKWCEERWTDKEWCRKVKRLKEEMDNNGQRSMF